MRTKTTQQADKMLDAAARLFGTQRFHEVRMEDIAAEAAVGKGTLYRYFVDKEELYLALLERSSRQLLDRLTRVLEAPLRPRERLTAVVAGVIAFFDERPHLLDLIQRAEVLSAQGFSWQQTRDELSNLLARIFEEGRLSGSFRIRDPELANHLLLGGMRNVVRSNRRPRPPDLAEQIVALFLEGAAERP